ncbi:hypothetical protein ACFQX6_21330 [Streptosporangium lutulentum]
MADGVGGDEVRGRLRLRALAGADPGPTGAVIPGYGYLHEVAGQKGAGTLGEAVHAAGQCTLAIGPGAALALADRTGKVDVYASSPRSSTPPAHPVPGDRRGRG